MITILVLLLVLYGVSFLLSPSIRELEKLSPYECGLEPLGDARMKYKIVYYILGILYLLFDLEIVFLYPLAISFWLLNSYYAFICFFLFIGLLTLGFIYEWKTGSLEVQ